MLTPVLVNLPLVIHPISEEIMYVIIIYSLYDIDNIENSVSSLWMSLEQMNPL